MLKYVLFNVIANTVTALVYAFFLRNSLNVHLTGFGFRYKQMLECAVLACMPALIVSTLLLVTGFWQIFPDGSGRQPARSFIYDVGFFFFQISGLYIISKWFLKKYILINAALDVSFNKIFFWVAVKTVIAGPLLAVLIILFVSLLH